MVKTWLTIGLLLIIGSVSAQPTNKALIHFDFDKYYITSQARTTLDSILALPRLNARNIQLYGHCDSLGDNSYNDQLSNRRVDAARNYLMAHQFPAQNIIIDSGYGKRMPLNDNADARRRKENRRVEIWVSDPPKTLEERINDTSTREGTHIVLKNLNFIGGRHVLVPQSWPVLTELLAVLRNNPGLQIEIQGHVCCTSGREGYDTETKTFTLSSNRAQYIYQYLLANGIDKRRLSWKAFGNKKPLYDPEDTAEKRMLNRRVEIRIVKK